MTLNETFDYFQLDCRAGLHFVLTLNYYKMIDIGDLEKLACAK